MLTQVEKEPARAERKPAQLERGGVSGVRTLDSQVKTAATYE